MLKRFDGPTQTLLHQFNTKSSSNCKLLICFATMYTILVKTDKHLPISFYINGTELIHELETGKFGENCSTTNDEKETVEKSSTTVNIDNSNNKPGDTMYEISFENGTLIKKNQAMTIDVQNKTDVFVVVNGTHNNITSAPTGSQPNGIEPNKTYGMNEDMDKKPYGNETEYINDQKRPQIGKTYYEIGGGNDLDNNTIMPQMTTARPTKPLPIKGNINVETSASNVTKTPNVPNESQPPTNSVHTMHQNVKTNIETIIKEKKPRPKVNFEIGEDNTHLIKNFIPDADNEKPSKDHSYSKIPKNEMHVSGNNSKPGGISPIKPDKKAITNFEVNGSSNALETATKGNIQHNLEGKNKRLKCLT